MSITVETAKDHAKDPAVLCCRAEAGIIIQPENLEDPALFADLEDSGLLKMPEDCLTIEQVLGAKLTKTLDALIPLTPDALEGVNQTFDSKEESSSTIKAESEDNNQKSTEIVQPVISSHSTAFGTQTLKLSIAKGEGIELEIPLSIGGVAVPQTTNQEKATNVTTSSFDEEQMVTSDKQVETKKIRSLIKKHFKIDKVDFADETKIEGTTLFLRNAEEICEDAVKLEELVEHMKLEIITPENYGCIQ